MFEFGDACDGEAKDLLVLEVHLPEIGFDEFEVVLVCDFVEDEDVELLIVVDVVYLELVLFVEEGDFDLGLVFVVCVLPGLEEKLLKVLPSLRDAVGAEERGEVADVLEVLQCLVVVADEEELEVLFAELAADKRVSESLVDDLA